MENNIHIVAKVTKINDTSVNVKPVIKKYIANEWVELPIFENVPLINMQGGQSYIHFPIAIGDYALLIINDNCINDWFLGDDNAPPKHHRIHDYSDAFAIIGVQNKSKALTIPTTTTVEGDMIINGDVTLNGNLTVNGSIHATGNISTDSDVSSSAVSSLNSHTHSGVHGQTSPPNN